MAGEVAQRFGQRMRQRRLELKLKQREVADAMGGAVTKQHISDWERGYNEPSDRYKLQLVDALQVPDVGWFYEAPNGATPDVFAAFPDSSAIEARLRRIESLVSEVHDCLLGDEDADDAAGGVVGLADRLLQAVELLQPPAGDEDETPPEDDEQQSA